jgi:hypothetical protein
MTLPEPSYRFTILIDRVPGQAVLRLPGLGADFGVHGYPVADVRQRAPFRAAALAVAIPAIEGHAGVRCLHVVDNDHLTLAEMAEHAGLAQETMRRYATGQRLDGGFPPPVNPSHQGAKLYRWSQVEPWLRARVAVPLPPSFPEITLANLYLQARQLPDHGIYADLLLNALLAPPVRLDGAR